MPQSRHRDLWRDPVLLIFAGCVFLFQLSNAAVLPFAITAIADQGLKNTDILVAIALVVSQAITAGVSPRLGGFAEKHGRKKILLIGFGALALRCLILAIDSSRATIIGCQLLDGISAASMGVMVPLIVSDITHRGGRFNLALGLIGLTMTAGATLSTTITGFVTQYFGAHIAFLGLAVAAVLGCVMIVWVLPETGRGLSQPAHEAEAQGTG